MFELLYSPGWDVHFSRMDKSVQAPIIKKIKQLVFLGKTRHLEHGLPFFVVECGQYRICFKEKDNKRIVVFVGDHKQYEKWYESQ